MGPLDSAKGVSVFSRSRSCDVVYPGTSATPSSTAPGRLDLKVDLDATLGLQDAALTTSPTPEGRGQYTRSELMPRCQPVPNTQPPPATGLLCCGVHLLLLVTQRVSRDVDIHNFSRRLLLHTSCRWTWKTVHSRAGSVLCDGFLLV